MIKLEMTDLVQPSTLQEALSFSVTSSTNQLLPGTAESGDSQNIDSDTIISK